jgi:hypothetical protein
MHDDVFGKFVYEPTDRLYRELPDQTPLSKHKHSTLQLKRRCFLARVWVTVSKK